MDSPFHPIGDPASLLPVDFVAQCSQVLPPLIRSLYTPGPAASGGLLATRHVGWLLHVRLGASDPTALLWATDFDIRRVGGVPMHTLLLAVPKLLSEVVRDEHGCVRDLEGHLCRPVPGILILRPIARDELAISEITQAMAQHHRFHPFPGQDMGATQATGAALSLPSGALDTFTRTYHSYCGFRCQVLGTIYPAQNDHGEWVDAFGSDVEYAPGDSTYSVIKPDGALLNTVLEVIKTAASTPLAQVTPAASTTFTTPPVTLGAIQYSITQNLHHNFHVPELPAVGGFAVEELLACRTALFGMTRTGKSNAIKVLLTRLQVAHEEWCQNQKEDMMGPLGQLIFDINGEYANDNQQDGNASLAQAFGGAAGGRVVVFRVDASGKGNSLLPNFHYDLVLGHHMISRKVKGKASSEAFTTFFELSFVPPPSLTWEHVIKVFFYRWLLLRVGYKAAPTHSEAVMAQDFESALSLLAKNPGEAAHVQTGRDLLNLFKQRWNAKPNVLEAELSPKVSELDVPGVSAIWQLLLGKSKFGDSGKGQAITGQSYLGSCLAEHSPSGARCGLAKAIIDHMDQGRVVILDLSNTVPSDQYFLMEHLAASLFSEASYRFTAKCRPKWMIYIEEAHNLIGTKADVDHPWPRIAKEGGKYGLGLVYATQEPSSIQSTILGNTENMIVSHLNNKQEVANVAARYDFEVFSGSILRVQTPGFIRLKQKRLPFTMPIMVHAFNAHEASHAIAQLPLPAPSFSGTSVPAHEEPAASSPRPPSSAVAPSPAPPPASLPTSPSSPPPPGRFTRRSPSPNSQETS